MAYRVLIHLVDLLEEQDHLTASLTLTIFVQCCAFSHGRESLLTYVPKFIQPMIASTATYDRRPYRRAIFIIAALCRQDEWRYLDPEATIKQCLDTTNVHHAIYVDLQRTMKRCDVAHVESLSLAQLVVLPSDEQKTKSMSKLALKIGAKGLCDYVSHPHDSQHYHTLSYDALAASCGIIEGLASHVPTSAAMFSFGCVLFLVKSFYQSRFYFRGNSVSDTDAVLILHALISASNGLGYFCISSRHCRTNIRDIVRCFNSTDLKEAACYFLKAMTNSNLKLEPPVKALLIDLTIAIVSCYYSYADMILSGIFPASYHPNKL